ncbi:MAG: sigma 54-interacting transcriptional regulator [Chthoniobacter sp.]|nr:sigma 54-interacting transcriptional regulator [Chthoniobacter sp.]
MVSMAQNRTLPEVLGSIVSGIAACEHVVLARIWLLNGGDICATCRFREECPDQTRCLHLVASAGNSTESAADFTRTDGAFRRFPVGVRKIGAIAQSGQPLLIPGVHGAEAWIADREWFARERIQTFAGQPLVFRGEVLGVLAIFDRLLLDAADFEWLRIFADHAAVSIANANAFEEIAFLKERLEEENSYLREEVSAVRGSSDLVGESAALRKVQQQIELVAPTDATVLVTGESGTGKELVARAIHARSPRASLSMIAVNCGAVPEPLFESEFFGHVKGAFTGALRDKAGRFELADGGTLFLDEIGEVPLPMQAKLLRVLQEQEVERVGDTRPRKVNVRIIAATNRDLKAAVEAGRFRQDLFYRLSVFPIENPPLRDRREDIPRLAEHFIRIASKRMNRRPPKFTNAAARQLTSHDWPGNVRELQNAVERAVILAQGGPLQFDPPPSSRPNSMPPQIPDGSPVLTRADLKLRERESIAAALAQTKGKVFGPDGAAALLGMKPTTLASRIKALGLQRK